MNTSPFPYHFAAFGRYLTPATLLALLLLPACNRAAPATLPVTEPEVVTFAEAGVFPEGIQYDAANNRFLVSSLAKGAIGQVKDDGTYAAFADHAEVVSSLGMCLDLLNNRNRLLVTVADVASNLQRTSPATQYKLAKLAIFSHDNSADAPVVVDLGRLRPALDHAVNDVTVDAQGNAYVTDSFAPIIYKIDAQTNVASVFVEDNRLGAPKRVYGLNGIVYHPDGYLLVNKSDDGTLYKVPLANPAGLTRIATPGQDLRGADGMLLHDDETLQVTSSTQNKVFRLVTADGWATGAALGTFNALSLTPTALARRGNDSYVLYANLLVINTPQPQPTSFTIGKVRF